MFAFSAFPTLGISEMDVVQALLFALAVLLWEILKWLKLVANSLGCNPARTKSINQLMKKLGYKNRDIERPSRLSEPELAKLDEQLSRLLDIEMFDGPAKAGQSIRLIQKVDTISKLLEARIGS